MLLNIIDDIEPDGPQQPARATPNPGGKEASSNMGKVAALEEMLKMALTDPEPPAPASLRTTLMSRDHPDCRMQLESLGELRHHTAHFTRERGESRDHVPRDEMAARVTAGLLSLTSKEVVSIQLLAIQILWALSADSDGAGEIARRGGLRFLLQLLREGGAPTNDHRLYALDALQSFAANEPRHFVDANGVKTLMDVMRFGEKHVQLKVALCLRNLVLPDAADVIPFGALVEFRPSMGSENEGPSAASAVDTGDEGKSESEEGREGSNTGARDTWPGLLAILQSCGILFELVNGAPKYANHSDHGAQAADSAQMKTGWEHLRPQPGEPGEKSLWRVEGVPGELGAAANGAKSLGFVPSLLFVAYRFGFDRGSETLLLRLVREAVQVGWEVTVFAIEVKQEGLGAFKGFPGVRITTDANVFGEGFFDLLCIHQCDMLAQSSAGQHDSTPLRLLVIPTNTTAGIAGLRKASRIGVLRDDSLVHVGVAARSKCGVRTMESGPPPILHPLGVSVDLRAMPSVDMLLDGLRRQCKGMVRLTLLVTETRDFPLGAADFLVLTVTQAGKLVFRSEPKHVGSCNLEAWYSWESEEISLSSLFDCDSDAVVVSVLGITDQKTLFGPTRRRSAASSASDSFRCASSAGPPRVPAYSSGAIETLLASASSTIQALRTQPAGRVLQLKLVHAGEFFGKKVFPAPFAFFAFCCMC